jgi:hypothetical protein
MAMSNSLFLLFAHCVCRWPLADRGDIAVDKLQGASPTKDGLLLTLAP